MTAPSTLPPALVSWVHERIGLHVDAHNQEVVVLTVRALADESDMTESDYLNRLLAGRANTQVFIDRVTNHESFFLRAESAMALAVGKLIPAMIKQGARPRCLSVPCAQGEEPFSLAMLLRDQGVDLRSVEITGADIAHSAIETARRGVYGKGALRRTPSDFLARHFVAEKEGRMRVKPEIRQAVDFHQVSLLHDVERGLAPGFHVVFCQNLLIYFDDATTRRALDALARLLHPEGWLFVAPAEAQSALKRFRQIWVDGVAAFRQPEAEAPEPRPHRPAAAARRQAPRGAREPLATARERRDEHAGPPRQTATSGLPANPEAIFGRAVAAYGAKAFDEALTHYDELLRDHPGWVAKALLGQARIYADEDDSMTAIERAEAALGTPSVATGRGLSKAEQAEAHAIIGLILRKKGLEEAGRLHFAEVKRLDPEHPAARFADSDQGDGGCQGNGE